MKEIQPNQIHCFTVVIFKLLFELNAVYLSTGNIYNRWETVLAIEPSMSITKEVFDSNLSEWNSIDSADIILVV